MSKETYYETKRITGEELRNLLSELENCLPSLLGDVFEF